MASSSDRLWINVGQIQSDDEKARHATAHNKQQRSFFKLFDAVGDDEHEPDRDHTLWVFVLTMERRVVVSKGMAQKKTWWYQGEDVEKSRMPVEHSRALFETQFEQSIEKQEVEFSRIKVEHVGSMSHSHVVVIPNSAVKSRASPFWTTIPWSADKAMKRSCGWLAWTSSQQVDLWYW